MKHVGIADARAAICTGGIIAVARGVYDQAHLRDMAEVLCQAGITVLEVTLNSAAAEAHIRMLSDKMGDRMLIGAGTVRTAEQVDVAVTAGAQFLISPGFDPATVAQARQAGILHVPGVMTPSEAEQAALAGCTMLKLFPAEMLAPAYLKALRAPLDDIAFVPTGGISVDNIGAWRKAGAVAVAVGSSLVAPGVAMEQLKQRAIEMRCAWNGAAPGR